MTLSITALRALLAAGTPGPWRQGFVTGQCRKPEHRDGHPGPRGVNPCVYEYRIVADDEIQRCYISVEPNVTLIGSDDHGPILSEADTALIVAAHEALPELLDEVERLRALASTLADAAEHCRMCRDCGDGPCCGACGVTDATAAIRDEAKGTK